MRTPITPFRLTATERQQLAEAARQLHTTGAGAVRTLISHFVESVQTAQREAQIAPVVQSAGQGESKA